MYMYIFKVVSSYGWTFDSFINYSFSYLLLYFVSDF